MKLKTEIRNKRRKDLHNLYQKIQSTSDNEKEQIYSSLKKTYKAQTIIDLFYNILEKDLSIILTEIQSIFISYDENTPITISKLLYKKDNKTLEQRIKDWFKEYPDQKEDLYNLFQHLCVILDTEKQHLIPATIKQKTQVKYGEIEVGGGECSTGICADMAGEGVLLLDELEEPPFHPNCTCELYEYEEEDIDKSN